LEHSELVSEHYNKIMNPKQAAQLVISSLKRNHLHNTKQIK